MKTGFDNEKYLKIQSEQIKKRIAQFGDKLYLEFGGKLFDDNHASRVLPGFKPDGKLDMLKQLKAHKFLPKNMRLRYANVHIHISARFTFGYLSLQTGAVLCFVNSVFGICKCKSPKSV